MTAPASVTAMLLAIIGSERAALVEQMEVLDLIADGLTSGRLSDSEAARLLKVGQP